MGVGRDPKLRADLSKVAEVGLCVCGGSIVFMHSCYTLNNSERVSLTRRGVSHLAGTPGKSSHPEHTLCTPAWIERRVALISSCQLPCYM